MREYVDRVWKDEGRKNGQSRGAFCKEWVYGNGGASEGVNKVLDRKVNKRLRHARISLNMVM